MGWLLVVTILEPIFSILVWVFYLRATYGIGGLIISIVRGVEIWLDLESIFRIFDIAIRPQGVRVQDLAHCAEFLSLERPFKGCANLQTPRGWANHRPIAWPWLTEYYTTWLALFCYHEADTETRSPIMRHFSWTLFWREDEFTWGIWWWCTWSHVTRARLAYSPMAASSLECSRMSVSIWVERQILRPQHLWYIWWVVFGVDEIW